MIDGAEALGWYSRAEGGGIMPSPFPGMDPYIERPEIFPDFHDRFITYISAALQPILRPKYIAMTKNRLYMVEIERARWPDLALVRTKNKGSVHKPARGRSELLELDRPAIFELEFEQIREPYIQIIEPSARNRIVTAIEVLSPDNKRPGPGRKSYLEKRQEFWDGGANLVEIDLLRAGEATLRVSTEKLESLRPWHYLASVTRYVPAREEVYPILLQNRLPQVGIPLTERDQDVGLNLQAAFSRCWEEGPYPEVLDYDRPPPGKLKPDEVKWCVKQLRSAGMRNGR